MKKEGMIGVGVALVISTILVFVGSVRQETAGKLLGMASKPGTPVEVYRVYLEGKSLGLISSKEKLEEYIDQEQTKIKEKYKVDKVYIPNDLDIVREITYENNLATPKEIYQKIEEVKGIESFTINGYKVVIEGVEESSEAGTVKGEDKTVYVIDRAIFDEASSKTAYVFVDKTAYTAFEQGKQQPITDVGRLIEDVYVKNKMKISEEKIPTGAKIYTSVDELTKYLLFGTTEDQAKYTVKPGDTIEGISFSNKLSPEEFLIANPTFKSTDDLLYPGQIVTLGVIQPQFKVIEEDHVVEKKEVEYNTKYENDENEFVGYEKVKQEGQNGIQIVTSKVQKTNGQITNYVQVETEKVKPSVDKIIVRGTRRQQSSSGSYGGEVRVPVGSWVWPTAKPYQISSKFGWRWGRLHEAVDITGPGRGSPIYAANNGVIVQSKYDSTNGNFIVIKHSNGYYTMYAHMQNRYKSAGEDVYANDKIGTMGDTGLATGVHLHFGVYIGMPYRGGTPINPLGVVR